MSQLNDKQIQEGIDAVKKNLEEDGWQILLQNRSDDNPLDIRAMRGADVIICHISHQLNGEGADPDLKTNLKALKDRAIRSNAFPFSVEVHYRKDGTINDILYQQVL
jgi:hypothetical protein